MLAAAAPASAAPGKPTVASTQQANQAQAPAPNLGALKQALEGVVTAGAPGVFARVEDNSGRSASTVSVGTGNIATHAPVNPNGVFRVGSITKTFSAVLVLQLVAQHKVSLDTAAIHYLPSGVLPANSTITVRQLLNHTSGLYDYTNDLLTGDTVTGYQKFRYQTFRPQALVADALKHGQQFPPGARYSYSNTNFVVLGMLIEHITGKPYAQVLNQRIIAPLGMTHTRFVVPHTTIDSPHAIGYLTNDDRSKPLFDATNQTASWIWTAGAAISSTSDLNRFLRALATGHLLPPAQLAEMETMESVSPTSHYGLGLRQYDLSCGTSVIGHDGIIEGYQTYTYTTKDGTRQVTISANASNNSDIFSAERKALEPVFCGKAAPAVQQQRQVVDTQRIAQQEMPSDRSRASIS
ncbi:serine hydrolase domain-containing protein [Streptantibioticus ferralitis]|uniref:Serine hydrolase n=1 Tax=Streptantibioticus ferralitis TaxID=236510 RepID=A0ABT5YUQ7_9ACTN|nr:serine hydrolase domain-containing protein [Streptantibioticus ferralitis]MDF2255107.1 serine hydrolase [Streptantibioticus ferralitis]